MSDPPSAINGKKNSAWGTLGACPSCGACLCFGCHPAGPCVDDEDHAHAATMTAVSPMVYHGGYASGPPGAWFVTASSPSSVGMAGLRGRATTDPATDLLR